MMVRIYTDGACRGNPGPGGWGAVLLHGDHRRELSGASADTTNNRMELTAAIRALEALTRRSAVDLYTDSTYVRDGITQWLPNWKARGWRTATKSRVKNRDLWEASMRSRRATTCAGTGCGAMTAMRRTSAPTRSPGRR